MSSQYRTMTRHVITYTGGVSRWQPDARERLERAAIELFAAQGFAATTVPQITARAGLTTRTFFRHFADKREVLFGGEEIPEFAAQIIADTPASMDPLALIVNGLRTVAESRFDGQREEFRQRRAIIMSDEGLMERDRGKRAALAEVIRDGLVGRGINARTAALLAESSVTVLHVALNEWLDSDDDNGQTLFELILDALASLRAALALTDPGAGHPATGGLAGGVPEMPTS
jgi:AcrR family transcriptional regulator